MPPPRVRRPWRVMHTVLLVVLVVARIGPLALLLKFAVTPTQDILRTPLLYLSLYLKTHRADYYRLLQEVRERGSWEAWLEFFLDGVAETANQAFDAATRIVDLFKQDRERITVEEIQGDLKIPVLRAYLKNWKSETSKFFGGLTDESPDEALRAAAPNHPMFRITSSA